MKSLPTVTVTLDKIVGGGQALGSYTDGRKLFVWGGLPGETVTVQVTKKKSSLVEGIVTSVEKASPQRVFPHDPESFLSTSPWQIMNFDAEQHYKSALIEEAFELHDIVLPAPITVYTDGRQYEYRNKIEYSFWYDTSKEILDLAFFRRGTHGKIPIVHTSLASPEITAASKEILRVLNTHHVEGRALKTLLIRSNQKGEVAWQLYVKDEGFPAAKIANDITMPRAINGEVIYSNPKSPASIITKRLFSSTGDVLSDTVLDVPFRYATEGFFQINLPVYEQALRDMKQWIEPEKPVLDLYSGVGTIGLTIGGENVTMVEANEHAVREMRQNITAGKHKNTRAILAPSEHVLEYIVPDSTIIVDPPRAGLHEDVTNKLLSEMPARIIYLSCNPATQARDVLRLSTKYGIRTHQGYNFFPRTPHIEHLVILDLK
jgi:23S rRNA (uracil1939-C5)-methyltransferase